MVPSVLTGRINFRMVSLCLHNVSAPCAQPGLHIPFAGCSHIRKKFQSGGGRLRKDTRFGTHLRRIFFTFWGACHLAAAYFLHFLAWSSVLLVYGIAWELTNRHLFAFLCGMLAAIWPEYIYFSNILLTEVPSGFFNILALYTALNFMRRQRIPYLYIAFASATYAVLIRAEYLLNFFVFSLFFVLWLYWKNGGTTLSSNQFSKIARHILIAFLIALLPLLAWAHRNYQSYNYFGLTSYTGDVLYDGFVVAGNALGIPVINEDSPAIKSLKEAYIKDKKLTIEQGQPWPEWRKYGVNTYSDGMSLMKFSGGPWIETVSPVLKRAALDSILSHPYYALRLVRQAQLGASYKVPSLVPGLEVLIGQSLTSSPYRVLRSLRRRRLLPANKSCEAYTGNTVGRRGAVPPSSDSAS